MATPEFNKFLTTIKLPCSHLAALAPGLRDEIIGTDFTQKAENLWMHINDLPFTHPEPPSVKRTLMLDHYRFYANELYASIATKANEFVDGQSKVIVDEAHLEQSKQVFLSLIERIISGDPKYAPYLNEAVPEDDGLGKRFVILKVISVLHRQTLKGNYAMFVGLIAHAFDDLGAAGAVMTKELYDNVMGIE